MTKFTCFIPKTYLEELDEFSTPTSDLETDDLGVLKQHAKDNPGHIVEISEEIPNGESIRFLPIEKAAAIQEEKSRGRKL